MLSLFVTWRHRVDLTLTTQDCLAGSHVLLLILCINRRVLPLILRSNCMAVRLQTRTGPTSIFNEVSGWTPHSFPKPPLGLNVWVVLDPNGSDPHLLPVLVVACSSKSGGYIQHPG